MHNTVVLHHGGGPLPTELPAGLRGGSQPGEGGSGGPAAGVEQHGCRLRHAVRQEAVRRLQTGALRGGLRGEPGGRVRPPLRGGRGRNVGEREVGLRPQLQHVRGRGGVSALHAGRLEKLGSIGVRPPQVSERLAFRHMQLLPGRELYW